MLRTLVKDFNKLRYYLFIKTRKFAELTLII